MGALDTVTEAIAATVEIETEAKATDTVVATAEAGMERLMTPDLRLELHLQTRTHRLQTSTLMPSGPLTLLRTHPRTPTLLMAATPP